MTQQHQSNRAAILTVDLRNQTMCAAWLLALAIAAVPASAIGASDAPPASTDGGDSRATETMNPDKAPQADAPKAAVDSAVVTNVGDAEMPARAGGIAGAVDQKTYERYVTVKGKDDLFANELEEADVITGDGEDIGDVEDVLIGPDGRVRALVVEVGGMLGLGQKKVAVRYDQFEHDVDDKGMLELKLKATNHELEAAPRFIPVREYENEPQTDVK